jgi:hypothetical protein
MIITLVGKSSKTLLGDFDAAGIEYETRLPQPGMIMNSADAVRILELAIPSVAAVIVAWLKYAPTRKVMITQRDNRIWQAEGRSIEEVEQLLISAKTIMALDAKKSDSDAITKPHDDTRMRRGVSETSLGKKRQVGRRKPGE